MEYDPGFPIAMKQDGLGFTLSDACFENGTEMRKLDSIRASLRDPQCQGPEDVYAIMMDVGLRRDKAAMESRMLLFGVVAYAAGQLGQEPIRSQGHIHKVSAHCDWSTPEVYEIWNGEAVIYMQQTAQDDPGRCYAVHAKAGDVVVVPPYWAHATISANPRMPLVFGAWCDRDYGFEYDDIRRHHGIAWFPLVGVDGRLQWERNPMYQTQQLICKAPKTYPQLGIIPDVPIYRQFQENLDRFLFVSHPALKQNEWIDFVP